MIKNWFLLQALYIATCTLTSYFVASSVEASDLSTILQTLQNISAAVFTLAGIWIAYIYPEAISAYTNNKVSLLSGSENVKQIESLVLIIFTSAFVLLGILMYNISYSLLINNEIILNNIKLFRKIAVGFVLFLTLNQVKSILSVMKSNIKFIENLHKLKTEKELDDNL